MLIQIIIQLFIKCQFNLKLFITFNRTCISKRKTMTVSYDGSCLLHMKMTAKLLKVNSLDLLGGNETKATLNNFLNVLNIPGFHTFQDQCFISDTPTFSTARHWSWCYLLGWYHSFALASFTSSRTPAVDSAFSKINGAFEVPLPLKHYLKAHVEHYFSYTLIFQYSLTTE